MPILLFLITGSAENGRRARSLEGRPSPWHRGFFSVANALINRAILFPSPNAIITLTVRRTLSPVAFSLMDMGHWGSFPTFTGLERDKLCKLGGATLG